MLYDSPELKLFEDRVVDCLGTTYISDIPDVQPKSKIRLRNASPIIERIWRVALGDIETNTIKNDLGAYFAAGAKWGNIVFTRDNSYSGVLGLNRIYPDLMRSCLDVTRKTQWNTGFAVTAGHAVRAIKVDWLETGLDNEGFKNKYHQNCYSRRTDDIVWLWCAHDLLCSTNASNDDWKWLYDNGVRFFERFYRPFFDPSDGLFRGQVSFVDVTWPGRPRPVSGYPANFTVEDCIMLKPSSTNALYLKGLRSMSDAASRLGLAHESRNWSEQAEKLQQAIRKNLVAPDGRIACYKDRHGRLSDHSDALGIALCVIHDAVEKETGIEAVKNHPRTGFGIPLFNPFLPNEYVYHNNASWPFSDTFFLMACEKALGKPQYAYNLALLARVVKADGFREYVNIRTGEASGSGRILWSAASFINACFRAGLLDHN
ncbi:MAG TPA: hypothetical protein PK821_03805 [Victivallales bacterium]|nr:hypothetical protein [Victivallales bacterium]